ncbi:MAG: FadR/GntR family transcriptional regulator [Chloroflexota bacterium]
MAINLSDFRAEPRPNAVNDVIKAIQDALKSGDLQPSQRLPSEANLGEQLGVGRGTIREAMKMLKAMGVVEVRQGDGTYISDRISPSVINPMLFAILLEAKNVGMLYEFRRMIDTGYCELAAEKATDEDFDTIEKVIDEMENYWNAGGRDNDELVQLDLKFHQSIMEATGNRLVVTIGEMLKTMFQETLSSSVSAADGVVWTIAQHRRMLAALRSRDLHAIRDAVAYGLDGSKNRRFDTQNDEA